MNADAASPTTTFAGFPPGGHINCPMCDYPLAGLPAEYACPECGFEYDAETCVLTSRYPIWFDYLQVAAIAMLVPLLIPVFRTFSDWRLTLWFVILHMSYALMGLRVYFGRRRHPAILVVGPEGLAYRTSGRREFCYSLLPDTENVALKRKLSRMGYNLHIECIDSRTVVLEMPFHWKEKQLGPICDAAQARLQIKQS